MATVTETGHAGEFLMSPSDDMSTRSFDYVTADQNQSWVPGTILGAQTLGALSAVSAAKAGNTGNGVLTLTGSPVAAGAGLGAYKVLFQSATNFVVFKPDLGGGVAQIDGEGVVGTAYNGSVKFTIAAGGTAFVQDDDFTVTASAAAGAGNSTALSLTATDGTAVVSGISYDFVTTGAGVTKKATAVTRAAEVNGGLLTYPAGATTNQIAAINAGLAALGIIVR